MNAEENVSRETMTATQVAIPVQTLVWKRVRGVRIERLPIRAKTGVNCWVQ